MIVANGRRFVAVAVVGAVQLDSVTYSYTGSATDSGGYFLVFLLLCRHLNFTQEMCMRI